MNDDCHAAFIYPFNCMTGGTNLVHMVKILKITYSSSWKSRKISWMKNGKEVGLYISNQVYGFTCGYLLAKSTVTSKAKVSYHSDNMSIGQS